MKPGNTLRWRRSTLRTTQSDVVHAVQSREERPGLQTKEAHVDQQGRDDSSGQDSTVRPPLKGKGHSPEDSSVHVFQARRTTLKTPVADQGGLTIR